MSIHKNILIAREKNLINNFASKKDLEHSIFINKIMNLKENEIKIRDLDKIFASVWYNNNTVFAGTKDNKLLKINVENQKIQDVPLLKSGYPRLTNDGCGIHSIAVNPKSNLLVTGGEEPSELGVYKLPNMQPLCVLTGHKNWSFACDWLDDYTVISGSRDKSVSAWRIKESDSEYCRTPINTKINHNHKVRDLKVMRKLKSFATLSSDCTLKVWDQNTFAVTNVFNLEGRYDLVSLAVDDSTGILAVGSQSKITLFDIRDNTMIKDITSLDDNQGVRSLNITGNIISIGGGYGRLSFYDLLKSEYIKVNKDANQLYFKTGKGWKYHENSTIFHAVYSHSWNHSASKLFVAGGPINYHEVGSYASVWE